MGTDVPCRTIDASAQTPSPPLLEVESLCAEFRTRQGVVRAVDGVSFSVQAGETLAIVGESGSGKSATALSIMGLLPSPHGQIVSGHVRLNGQELTRMGERELSDIRGRQMGMIFQDPLSSLNPAYTVGHHLVETLRRHLPLTRSQARARAVELLAEVRISNPAQRINVYPHQLSGGMRQRVMIALALSCGPALLLADEPTTALDVTIQMEILALLDVVREAHSMGMVLITHDMGVAAATADRIAVMYAGQIVEEASAVELFERPEHPYTEALLGALPPVEDEDARNGRLSVIPGSPPSLIDPPEGCRFRARCPYAHLDDACSHEIPELREISPGHWLRTAHPASARETQRAHA